MVEPLRTGRDSPSHVSRETNDCVTSPAEHRSVATGIHLNNLAVVERSGTRCSPGDRACRDPMSSGVLELVQTGDPNPES